MDHDIAEAMIMILLMPYDVAPLMKNVVSASESQDTLCVATRETVIMADRV